MSSNKTWKFQGVFKLCSVLQAHSPALWSNSMAKFPGGQCHILWLRFSQLHYRTWGLQTLWAPGGTHDPSTCYVGTRESLSMHTVYWSWGHWVLVGQSMGDADTQHTLAPTKQWNLGLRAHGHCHRGRRQTTNPVRCICPSAPHQFEPEPEWNLLSCGGSQSLGYYARPQITFRWLEKAVVTEL